MLKGEIHVKDKKVLLFGLGLLGGGIATANWLISDGAQLAIHDIKSETDLESSLKKINGNYDVKMGRQLTKDEILEFDVICINPDVSFRNPLIEHARNSGVRIINEAVIFYSNYNAQKIAVTGTRGKTTTVNWITHLLNSERKAITTGNSYKQPLLKSLHENESYDFAVTEMSSYLLELFDAEVPAPDIAVITNLSSDHLNRYFDMTDYASAKANIFRYQKSDQKLILNLDDEWTEYFLTQVRDSDCWFVSRHKLSKDKKGVYCENNTLYFYDFKSTSKICDIINFGEKWGEHAIYNLMNAVLVAKLCGISDDAVIRSISSLPQIQYRQEIVFDDDNVAIINDTTATSPEGGVASVNRFADKKSVFIFGGTDKGLDYSHWLQIVKEKVSEDRIIFLTGSATEKMKSGLSGFIEKDTLEECFDEALKKALQNNLRYIIFSPSAKSFEKFKNEFDRGEKFNEIIERRMKNEK